MLTTYASCWGSFLMRGSALMLLGAALLAAPAQPGLALPALVLVLIASSANAVSTGLRMRASSAGWWLAMLESAASLLLALAILSGRQDEAMALVPMVAALCALDGLVLLASAWRHRRGAYPVGAVAAAGVLSVGFGLLLSHDPSIAAGTAGIELGLVALALGIASAVAALRLRSICRLARHELLRDAPLACRERRRTPRRPSPRRSAAPVTARAVRVPA